MTKYKRPLVYLLGLTILGISVSLFQNTNLGMGSWDALNRNFYEGIPLDYKYITPIMALILISLAYLIEKKKPDLLMLFPFLISFYIGSVIDLFLLFVPNVQSLGLIINLLYVFSALILVAIGLNMIILCNFPLPALDQFCLAISRKFKISFGKGKLIGEALAFLVAIIVGFLFGHQEFFFFLGPNTFIALLTIGFFVDFFAKPVKRVIGEINVNRSLR